MKLTFATVIATTLLFTPLLSAHVAPSEDVNNRYIKLTPLGDRVRLSYTVYMGRRPGALARVELDSNRDGVISDAESQPFALQMGATVAAHLEIDVDGLRQPVSWTVQAVGLGTPTVSAGAFSVDLLGWLCLKDAANHRIMVRDRFHVPQPGETELRLTESPGVHITRATLGIDRTQSLLDMKWTGAVGPLETDGLVLEFTADAKTRRQRTPCSNERTSRQQLPPEPPTNSHTTSSVTGWEPLALAGAGLATLLLGALVLWFRRRSGRKDPPG